MAIIPERLTGYSVFRNGTERVGTSDVELPSLEALTDTVSGAGIAGEVDSPTIGHFGSMRATLNFRTLDIPMFKLSGPKSQALDFRGAQQVYDSSASEYKSIPVRVSVRGIPVNTTLGTFETNASTGSSIELECTYLMVMVDGVKVIEIDKYNYICFIDGVDHLAVVKQQLGL
ncbi:phage major tail tube protein [Paenibacillus wynnii]|uniref:Tail protein n=1 Tax=Paenibacillus wynnii TaxID=268407 RepID=A0A098MDI9_9BACL|nr:phage major tail tube protein [Paenibacillus wynnii]KGE20640.1 tail protein [Paenibacillus wynnii]KGE20698.1 tail protein [Paenibacillus wynnii]